MIFDESRSEPSHVTKRASPVKVETPSLYVCVLFFLRIHANREFIDDRQRFAELSEEDGEQHRAAEDGAVERDSDAARHEVAALLQCEREVRDDERVHEVGEVRMLAERVQDGIQCRRVFLIREDREEEQRGHERVEDALGRELVCRIDAALRRLALREEQPVIVGEEARHADPEEDRNRRATRLHEDLEALDVDGEPAAEEEDEDVVEHPVVQPVHEDRLQQ